jgi:hypothetical protein
VDVDTEGGAGYRAAQPVPLPGLGSPKVLLISPTYAPFEPEGYARHMADLWSELPGAFNNVRDRVRRRLASQIAEFAHRDDAAARRLADNLFAALAAREVVLYPIERYWIWRRTPALLSKHGVLMTGLGLWIGEQAYQLELETDPIQDAIGGHDLFVTGKRRLRSVGVHFDG